MFENKIDLGYLKELMQKIEDEDIKDFKELVDYVYKLEGVGYHDEYLKLVVDYTDFFEAYFNAYNMYYVDDELE